MRKQKKRALSKLGCVVVFLWDALFGVIVGELMAFWQLPSAYRWRGYWAIGGEWILIIGAIFLGAYMAHSFLMQWIFEGGRHGKVHQMSQSTQGSSSNRDRVRSEVLRDDVREKAAIGIHQTATARKNSRSA